MELFKTLTPPEIKSSQKWARDNFSPIKDGIKWDVWHPVVCKECQLMEEELTKFQVQMSVAEIRILRKVLGTEIVRTNGILDARESDRISELVFGRLDDIVTEANKSKFKIYSKTNS